MSGKITTLEPLGLSGVARNAAYSAASLDASVILLDEAAAMGLVKIGGAEVVSWHMVTVS
ncbi:MAG TPA: hypothetical protein VKT53_13475 [Candidatus Acidoferrum sp.]|nr:hypothetical protein [Candidatus Acidoferrum sp.]